MDTDTEKAVLECIAEIEASIEAQKATCDEINMRLDDAEADIEELQQAAARRRARTRALQEKMVELMARIDRIEAHPLLSELQNDPSAAAASLYSPGRAN